MGIINLESIEAVAQGTPEYTWTSKPTAPEFGKGQAWFSDLGAVGYSDGNDWTYVKNQEHKLPVRLTASDYIPGILFTASKDGNYAFGKSGDSTTLVRYDRTYTATTLITLSTLYNEDGITLLGTSTVVAMFTTKNGYVFLLMRRSSDSKEFLYKSIDNGVNWGNNAGAFNNLAPVNRVGLTGATHSAEASILTDRGFAEIVEGGRTFYAYGEYVTGSYPNSPGIVVSADLGTTWTRTHTLTPARHIHFIKQDPYHGYIWVGIGDGPTMGGLLRLDSLTRTIPAGMTYAQYNKIPGVKILYGAERYNTTDLHFHEDYFINPVDYGVGTEAKLASETGIWCGTYDMENYFRVKETMSTAWVGHSQYNIVKHTSSNTLITIELIEDNAATVNLNTIRFHCSSDDGLTWEAVATARLRTTRTSQAAASFFEWNDQIWIGNGIFAGGDYAQTVAIRPLAEPFDATKHGERVEVSSDGTEYAYGVESIIPAVYVNYSLGANSAGKGLSPRTPFQTMSYTFGSNRTANGSVVHITGTLADTNGVAPTQTSPLCPSDADPMYPTKILGNGKNGLVWGIATTSTVFEAFASPKCGRIDMVNVNLVNSSAGLLIGNPTDTDAVPIRIIDSKLSTSGSAVGISATKGNIDLVRSEVTTATGVPLKSNSGVGKITANDSYFTTTGTSSISLVDAGAGVNLTKCTFTGFTTQVVTLATLTDLADLALKDCLFYSASSTYSIIGNAAVTYTTANISNCVSNKPFSNVNGSVTSTIDAALTSTGYRASVMYPAVTADSIDVEGKPSFYVGCYSS